LPYYVAQRLLTLDELKKLRAAYYEYENAIGIVHIPPSRPKILLDTGDTIEVEVATAYSPPREGVGSIWETFLAAVRPCFGEV
jgi:hypothetical protein